MKVMTAGGSAVDPPLPVMEPERSSTSDITSLPRVALGAVTDGKGLPIRQHPHEERSDSGRGTDIDQRLAVGIRGKSYVDRRRIRVKTGHFVVPIERIHR